MPSSQSYLEFVDALGLAAELLKTEAQYPEPTPYENRKLVEGLRGGAAVLMVAAFESYLKNLIEEHFDELTRMPLRFKPEHIPEAMLFSNLEYLVTTSTKVKKDVKITKYREMANCIVSGVMTPAPFADAVRSNPNAQKLKEMFKRLGISDCYTDMKSDFETRWGVSTADTFVSDYLDSILERRHIVAHTANTLNISRQDLNTSLKFLRILGDVVDEHLAKHINGILNPLPLTSSTS